MGTLINILGAVMVGGLLLIVMISFIYQINESAQRQLYATTMVDHIEKASVRLNYIINMAGLGIEDPSTAVVLANTNVFAFRTHWDFQADAMGPTGDDPYIVSIGLYNSNGAMGKAVEIRQGTDSNIDDDTVLENMGYIFWVSDLNFKYFTKTATVTTTPANVRAAELRMTFTRAAPRMGSRDLSNKIQMKCFLMNTYLQEGT